MPTTSTTTPVVPTTTAPAPTTTVPIDPQFALLFDGFEQFGRLGDAAEPMIEAFIEAFGEPTADSEWKEEHACSFEGPMRTIVWIDPGIRVVFGNGTSEFGEGEHLVTYTTMLPVETPWRLFGLSRGMNIADAEELFPDAKLIQGPGLDSVQFDPDLFSYALVLDSGEIRNFWGGIEYCSG